jgi:hypothetical protein
MSMAIGPGQWVTSFIGRLVLVPGLGYCSAERFPWFDPSELGLVRSDLFEKVLPRTQPHYRALLHRTGCSCEALPVSGSNMQRFFQF